VFFSNDCRNLGQGMVGCVLIAKQQSALVADRVRMAPCAILPVFWLGCQVLGSKWKMVRELSCVTCMREGKAEGGRWDPTLAGHRFVALPFC